jgi:hypothetical protein
MIRTLPRRELGPVAHRFVSVGDSSRDATPGDDAVSDKEQKLPDRIM